MTGFSQSPPQLDDQYASDRVLRAFLERHVPTELLTQAASDLESLGRLAAGPLYRQQLEERGLEPTLTQWDAWGRRVDRIKLTPLWQEAHRIAASHGLVATGYEGTFQPYGRLIQFALAYLFHPSTDVFSCPLAMTDGAARALLDSGNQELIARAVGHLTSRDPARFWTSGQWMTETTGGSDVGASETVARRDGEGRWRLTGRKWFTSAATSDMALTLARPEGNPMGGGGLALFYVEPRDAEGALRNIEILRLKDKLGTRKLPTAELLLRDTPATPVTDLQGGVKAIAPMLNITRTWNAVCAVSTMRRALALARDYANRRIVFNRPLAEQPLHLMTLARQQAEFEGAFALTFDVVRLLGLGENGQLGDADQALLRLLTPVAKLTTGKQVVALTSELIESFGGAGYVEDTGLPMLLRDAQVLPIWEGTTNVLSLDVLRVLSRHRAALDELLARAEKQARDASAEVLAPGVKALERGVEGVRRFMEAFSDWDNEACEASARGLAMTLGRLASLGLLLDAGQHAIDHGGDPRPARAAVRYARNGVLLLEQPDPIAEHSLATDIYV
ncbi:MAG: acyl-CoA dehydrogenase family protein [Pseudomonadota bacterium]